MGLAKKPDKFRGRPNENVLQWLFTVNVWFNSQEGVISDERKVYLASGYFGENAASWFRSVHYTDLHTAPEHRITNDWGRFQQAFSQQFTNADYVKIARDKLARLRQIDSVSKYNYAFNQTMFEIPDMNPAEALHAYTRGLKNKIRIEVELRQPQSIYEAQRLAITVDNIFHRDTDRHSNRTYNDTRDARSDGPTPMEINNFNRGTNRTDQRDGNRNTTRDGNRSANPRSTGGNPFAKHRGQPLTPELRESLRAAGHCFYCRERGHISINCPNKRRPHPAPSKRVSFANIVAAATAEASTPPEN